jgi:uncharacterized protein YfbU (UPF0304 family)
MELNDWERRLLIKYGKTMQSAIAQSRDADQKLYWERFVDVFQRGYKEYYEKYLPDLTGIDLDPTLPDDVFACVNNILDVYSAIYDYKRRNPDDTIVATHHMSTFPGFWANTEGEYYGLVLYMCKLDPRPGVLVGVDPADLNSSPQMVPIYNAMIKYWQGLEEKNNLTQAQITKLLSFWTEKL